MAYIVNGRDSVEQKDKHLSYNGSTLAYLMDAS